MMDKDVQSVTQEDYGLFTMILGRLASPRSSKDRALLKAISRHRLASQPTSAEDAVALAGRLEALAGDCDNTDGWEGASYDVRQAAEIIRTASRPTHTQTAAIGAEAIFAETVDGRGWSLELLFGKGDDARDRMRAVSDSLRSQPVAAPQQPQSEAQADKGNAEPVENSGAVSNDALRHLEIRSPLNRTIYRVIRQHRMGNMYDEDGFVGYPLVDLMSNEAPADIGTGEMEMVTLADEIEAALLARPPAQPQSEKVAAPQAEMADDVNWKAEWEAASSANIRYRKALDQICDLGCCGGKGSFQKALDIAVSAVSSTPPQPEGGTVVYDLLAALILVRDNNRNGVKGAEARRGWEMANAAIKNALQPEKTK